MQNLPVTVVHAGPRGSTLAHPKSQMGLGLLLRQRGHFARLLWLFIKCALNSHSPQGAVLLKAYEILQVQLVLDKIMFSVT